MLKIVMRWLMPIAIVVVLLMTLGIFKQSATLNPEEQKKIDRYVDVE
ncbi:CapE family protein [Bacillus mycoides]